MLAKKNRLTTYLFERFFRRSKRISFSPFTFLISDSKKGFRGAIVVGKKISKSAVKRNKIRRQLYTIMQETLLPKNPPKNIICLYQGEDILKNPQNFRQACQNLLLKI